MPKFKGGESRAPFDYKTNRLHRRSLNITAADKLSTKSCGHDRPVVRNVVEMDGPCAYICKDCFGFLMLIETRAIVRRELSNLFRLSAPGVYPGAAIALEVAV